MTETINIILSIMLTIFSNTIAQILLKQSSQLASLLNVYFIGGITFYGISTLFYTSVLKNISLSVAYPMIIGMTIVCTIFLNTLIYREKLLAGQFIGIFFIVCGIFSITILPKST